MSKVTPFTKLIHETKQAMPGFALHVAIWTNDGRGLVAIGAPTLEELELRWKQITGSDLDQQKAQRCIIIQNNAPAELMEQAQRIAQGKREL